MRHVNYKNLIVVALTLCALVAVPRTYSATSESLSSQDQVQMYALIIQRLLGPDDTYSEPIPKGKVYVTTTLSTPPPPEDTKQIDTRDEQARDAAAHDQLIPPPPPIDSYFASWPKGTEPATQNISKEMQAKMMAAIGLPQYEFQWVSDPSKELKINPRSGALPDGRPILTLTQFVFLSPDRVYATGGIYVASQVSGICLYFFKKDKLGWHFEKRIQGPVS